MSRTIFKKTSRLTRNPFPAQGYGIHARRSAARASSLPPLAKRVAGRPTRGAAQSGVGGAPRRFVDDQARLSMAALAQPPQHPRRPSASPSHPPPLPLPLPATRLRRAGGGRSERPTCVNLVAGRERADSGRSSCGLPAPSRSSRPSSRLRLRLRSGARAGAAGSDGLSLSASESFAEARPAIAVIPGLREAESPEPITTAAG